LTTQTHVLVVLVAVASLAFVGRLLRRRRLSAKYAILWLVLGGIALAVATFPGLVDTPSRWLGIPSGVTVAFLGAITVLILVCVDYSWELSRLEEHSRTLAQEVALLNQRCDALEASNQDRVPGDAPPVI
jgi:hypothetical protein